MSLPLLFGLAFVGNYDSALYIQNPDLLNTTNVTKQFYDGNGN
jgi:hypothetical protein